MAKFTPALTLVVWLASLGALRAQETAKPLGTWERKIGKSHITLIVEESRLHAQIVGEDTITLHADYSITKDGIVYGVITSVECDDDEADKTIFDAPFSCRYRIDEGSLIIRDLKGGEINGKNELWNGRFKAVTPSPSRSASVPRATLSRPPAGPDSSAKEPSVFNFWMGTIR